MKRIGISNGKALLSGFEFEKQKSKIYFMDAQSYFDSQAHFNKWLKQLTEDEQRMVVDMLYEVRQQNSQQCKVSGSLLDKTIELFDILSDGERIIVMDGYCKGCGRKQDGGICSCVDF